MPWLPAVSSACTRAASWLDETAFGVRQGLGYVVTHWLIPFSGDLATTSGPAGA